MPSKAELVKDIYLLATIHLHDFQMSAEMAQKIFDRWPSVIPDRPNSPGNIIEGYNVILQQIPEQTLATQAPSRPSPTPKTSQSPKIVKNEIKNEITPEPSQSQKPTKNENTPEPSLVQKPIKPSSNKNENTPSPFRLANHSIRSIKPKPKLELAPAPQPQLKPASKATSRILKLESPVPSCKNESTDESLASPTPAIKSSYATTKSSTTKKNLITKRTFIDLTNDISSDEDETPLKKPRMK